MLVSQHYPPDSLGGVELYSQRLETALTRAGDTVSIVARRPLATPTFPQPIRERLPHGGVLYRLAGGYFNADRFLRHHERLERFFTEALLEEDPEVVHVNHLKSLSPHFLVIAHRLGIATVVSFHDFFFACPLAHLQKPSGDLCAGPNFGRECGRSCFAKQAAHPKFPLSTMGWGLRTLYFRRLLGLADRLVAGSRYVASYFENFGPRGTTVTVIPNGVDVEPLDPAEVAVPTPDQRGTLNLVYCGTVVPLKGSHVILEALRIAQLPSVHLLLMGQTPVPEYLQALRAKAALVPGLQLRVHGEFRPADFPILLQDRDLAIVPTLVPEAGPQVPREVLARGIPVLASRLGALPEVVAEGDNGFTFDPRRPEELAGILHRIVRDSSVAVRLREGALRTPVVTVAGHAQALRSVYQEAIADRMRNPRPQAEDLAEVNFLHRALIELGFAHP
jgi:glycosyltransferase involved in cell wall biosynthesis